MGIAIPQVVTEDRASGALSVGGSLRFNGSNQYLRKTFGTEGNRQVFTWSCWVKRNELDTWQRIFTCEPSSNNVAGLSFRDPDSKIRLQQQDNAGAQGNNHLLTTPTYRDISAFYHVVMAVDTVNATAADRFKIYINGERQSTTWDTGGNPAQLSKLFYNSGDDYHEIGHSTQYNAYQKGQMAQCYWIDGLQLEPSEFGFTDPLTNTWRPKKYTGAFSGSLTSVPTSTSNVAPSGGYGNTTPAATLLFGMPGPTSATSHIRQDGGGIEWSPAIVLSNDVAGAECVYLNNTSAHDIEFKIDGNWVTAQSTANTPIGTTAYGALITLTTTGNWTGVRATGGSNISVTGVTGIFVNGVRQYNTASNNGFYLPMDGSAPIGEDQSGNGNDFTPIFFSSSATPDQANGAKPILDTLGGSVAKAAPFGSDAGATFTTTSASNVGGKYVFENEGTQPTFSFIRGATYTFDWSASSGHPLRFSTTTQEGGGTATLYSDGVDVTGTVTTITVPHNAPDTLYYYCNVHSGMGNSISVTTDETKADPYAWKCVLAQPLINTALDVSDQINCTSTEKAITASGAAASTKFGNFYGASTYLDGNAKIQTPDNNDFDFGTGDFTVEIWARANSTSGDQYIVSWENPASGTRPDANHSGINIYNDNWRIGGFNNYLVNNNVGLQSETWMHIAMSRVSGTLRVFVNGTLIGSVNATNVEFNCSSNFTLGAYAGSSNPHKFVGYLQDLRVYKGVGKYVDNFAPASDDPDILPDSPSGVSVKSQLKKSTNGSVSFDGNTDNLVVLNHSDITFGTGLFTVECFLYMNTYGSSGSYPSFVSKYTDALSWILRAKNNGKIIWYSGVGGGTNNESSDAPMVLGKWLHVAAVREGTGSNQMKVYVDGKLYVTCTDGTDYTDTNGMCIGSQNTGNTNVIDGAVSNVRILKGTALYTSNFTPPTAPLTNITNTKLLCCQSPTSRTAGAVIPTGNITGNGNATATSFNPFTTDINTVRGQESNYCTWNPLTMSRGNLHDGNLLFYGNGTNTPRINGTISKTSGKWYYEATVLNDGPGTGSGDVHNSIGWGLDSVTVIETAPNTSAMNHSFYFMDSGYYKNFEGSNTNTGTGKWLTGDVIGVAADLDKNYLTFYKNGIQVLNQLIKTPQNTPLCPAHQSNTGNYGRSAANFGQKPFKFPPPDGFQPLSASSVRPDNVIVRPDQFFAVTKYDGNTDSSQDINVGFAPDLVWQKIYSQAGDHALTDTVRGVGAGYLQSEDADKEKGNANDGISAFLSNGFRAYNSFNNNGLNWVSWCWKAGGNKGTFNIDDVDVGSAANAKMSVGSLNDDAYNDDQTWSNNLSVNTGSISNAAQAFNGNLTNGADSSASTGSNDRTMSAQLGIQLNNEIVEVYPTNTYSGYYATIDGVNQPIQYFTTPNGFKTLGRFTGTLTGVTVTNGTESSNRPAGIRAIRVGGKILIDNGVTPPNAPSIAAQGCSIGTKQGFSIVTYTSTNASATIPHGLTQKPDFAIFKNRDSTLGTNEVDWGVYHSGIGPDSALELNQQLTKQTYPGPFNNVDPTQFLFHIGTGGHSYLTNGPSGDKFIAYIWHNVPGLQKFGVYDGTGVGGTTPFIELGFRPALVWLKSFEGSTSNWVILDDKRPGYNSELQTLCANLNNGHNASGGTTNDILSNGFKIRGSSDRNASNTKYIYAAWAASPFSNLYGAQSNAR